MHLGPGRIDLDQVSCVPCVQLEQHNLLRVPLEFTYLLDRRRAWRNPSTAERHIERRTH